MPPPDQMLQDSRFRVLEGFGPQGPPNMKADVIANMMPFGSFLVHKGANTLLLVVPLLYAYNIIQEPSTHRLI